MRPDLDHSHALTDVAGSRRPPGLLSWQVAFLAFVLGLLAPQYPWAALTGLGLLWLLHWLFTGRFFAAWALALGFGLGGMWMVLNLPPASDGTPEFMLRREKVELTGRVEDLDPKANGRIQIVLDEVRVKRPDGSEEPLPGKVVWNWDDPSLWPEPGQEVAAVFRVRPTHDFMNPGLSSFEFAWRCRGVFWRMYAQGAPEGLWLGPAPGNFLWELRLRLRHALLGGMDRPSPGAALILAQLLGDYSLLDDATLDMMRRAGLTHTLALSGMNVAYVVFFGWLLAWAAGLAWPGLLLRIPRPKLVVVMSAPLVLAFLWIGQFSGSLLRATVMFGVWGLFLLFDRRHFLLDSLFMALAGILLFNPVSVHDIGLQLSALSVAGLILFLPMSRTLHLGGEHLWARAVNGLLDLAAMSFIATMSIAPLLVWYFGEINPNFLVNLPWLPLLGAVVMPLGLSGMFLAALAEFVPLVPTALGGFLLKASVLAQQTMLDGLEWVYGLDLLPVYSVYRPRWPEMLGYAAVMLSTVALWMTWTPSRPDSGDGTSRPQGKRNGARPGVLLALGLGLAFMVLPHVIEMGLDLVRQGQGGRVELSVLDVGQGQSVLVVSPQGRRFLVDCGGSGGRRFDIGRSVAAPHLLWGHGPSLDGAFLSHPDSDHSYGLGFILDRFRVGFFAFNGVWPGGQEAPDLAGITSARGVPVLVPAAGQELDLGGGLVAQVVQTAEDLQAAGKRANEESLVLRLTWRGRGLALLPGDLDGRGIKRLLASNLALDSDLLVVPHHGSKGSLSPALYQRVNPRVAVISCGFLNAYHFPNPEVVRSLAGRGIPVLDTSRQGQVRAVWTGEMDGLAGPTLSSFSHGQWSLELWPDGRADLEVEPVR